MDVEKTIEFILEQSAATAVQLQQLTADVTELKEVTRQHTADLEAHTEWKLGLSKALQDLAGHMQAGFATVAEQQRTTEESLNILIRTVQDVLPRLPSQ
jgi:predicted  nucleic acid-binding Zn-ribbon protein